MRRAHSFAYKNQTDVDKYATAGENRWVFTNSLTAARATTDVSADKLWQGDNVFGTAARPATVEYTLNVWVNNAWETATPTNCGLAGAATQTVNVDKSTGAAPCTWDGLYKYANQATGTPTPMKYSVVEKQVDGYAAPKYSKAEVLGTDTNRKITVINSLDETSYTATKAWSGLNVDADSIKNGLVPNKLKFALYYSKDSGANWTKSNLAEKEYKTLDLLNGKITFDNLPKANGISYKVVETGVSYDDGKTWVAAMASTNGDVVTNTVDTGSLTVNKLWSDEENRDGKRVPSVTIDVLRDGTKIATVTLDEKNNWTATLNNLPTYKNGSLTEKSEYSLQENNVAGYKPTYTSANIGGTATVKNTYTPQRVTATAQKTWDDDGNKYGTRKDVTLALKYSLDNGKTWNDVTHVDDVKNVTDATTVYTTSAVSQTLSADAAMNTGAFKWENLPKYSNKTEVEYKAVETKING